MNDKYIEEFLRTHAVEIPDDGFSKRVMNALPETEWQRKAAIVQRKRISWLWKGLCMIAIVAYCIYTNAFTNLMVDAQAFFKTITFVTPSIQLIAFVLLLPTICLLLETKALFNNFEYDI